MLKINLCNQYNLVFLMYRIIQLINDGEKQKEEKKRVCIRTN